MRWLRIPYDASFKKYFERKRFELIVVTALVYFACLLNGAKVEWLDDEMLVEMP